MYSSYWMLGFPLFSQHSILINKYLHFCWKPLDQVLETKDSCFFSNFDQFNICHWATNTLFLEVRTALILSPVLQPSDFQTLDKSLWLSFFICNIEIKLVSTSLSFVKIIWFRYCNTLRTLPRTEFVLLWNRQLSYSSRQCVTHFAPPTYTYTKACYLLLWKRE